MSRSAFVNGAVLVNGRMSEGLAVLVEAGRIRGIVDAGKLPADYRDIHDLGGQHLLPGYVDTQVNGGGGVLFNDRPQLDGIAAIAAAHCRLGTTAFLPTLISDELDVVRRAMAAAEEAIDEGVAGVIGIHIEGPFLNPDRRGVHDRQRLRRLTTEVAGAISPIRNGTTLLTIAPEAADPDAIRSLAAKGIIVAAGHTNASYSETVAAIGQGLRGFTHLFNAMSQIGPREPGVVGAALDDAETWAGVIADGHHVSPVSLRIAYRCKGPDRMMLVSDAMPPVGSDMTEFSLLGRRIVVDGAVCRDANGTLAGTATDMGSAVRKIIEVTGCTLAEASRMASLSPARFLKRDSTIGSIEAGKRADLIVVDRELNVTMTLIGGRIVGS
ncbi:MAG: N-acetylglucosamine-6-phosphate deacetylase [Woeseiaceae bacterium]